MDLYHCSQFPHLSSLSPRQTRLGESNTFGLFLSPSLYDVLHWRQRLAQDRGYDHPYLYQVEKDPHTIAMWTDGDHPGSVQQWFGGETWLGQVWIKEAVACQAIPWPVSLDMPVPLPEHIFLDFSFKRIQADSPLHGTEWLVCRGYALSRKPTCCQVFMRTNDGEQAQALFEQRVSNPENIWTWSLLKDRVVVAHSLEVRYGIARYHQRMAQRRQ